MNNNELKEFIESIEKRIGKDIDDLATCVASFKKDIHKKIEEIRAIQLKCPVIEVATIAEKKADRAMTFAKWNMAVVSMFLFLLIFTLKENYIGSQVLKEVKILRSEIAVHYSGDNHKPH